MAHRDLRIAGMVASAVGLAAMFVVASVVPDAPFPPSALAERIIRLTPGDVATFFIELLHSWARRGLAFAAALLACLVGGEALVRITLRGRPDPPSAAAVLGIAAGAASFSGPAQDASVVPVAVNVVVAMIAYAVTASLVLRTLEAATDDRRRRVLRTGATAALGIAAGGWVAGLIARSFGGPNTDVDIVAPATPAATPADDDFPVVPGLSPEVTTAADHYVVDINLVQPAVEAEGWALRVFGAVDRPLSFDFASLQRAFEVVEEYSVLCCVSNEVGGDLIGHSAWGGVRLADVLDRAGVRSGAVDVVFRAADGYSDSIPLDVALRPDVLLAVSQNGAPLTQDHGFPCRVRVPAIFGMKNVKWLDSIEVVERDYKGYWQERGWSDVALVRTGSRIDVAGDTDEPRVGEPTWVAGIAWAGTRGIERVEVSADGGRSWADARLKAPISGASWTLWAYRWTPERIGSAEIVCRATDGEGRTQTDDEAPPHPAGATGYHRVTVEVAPSG